jgi:16S rRNA processing protein RimM
LSADEQRPGQEPAAAVLSAGRVGRAHGLDGSFYVTRPKSRLLRQGTTVVLDGQALEIVRLAGTEQRPIVRLAGVSGREAAERLRGLELTIVADEAPKLQEGEWWAHELEGCEVLDGAWVLGTVTRLIELPSCEALEVRSRDSGETLIVPMVRDAIRAVEPQRRRIEVDASFLGLEAP